jgi:23S rRNA (cytidine1920-2'-O)/16S rRNA (cytidine1409-2'-O)-methyltransferase
LKRVDELLVARGLAPSVGQARAMLLAGEVFSGERRVDKAGERLAVDAPLEVRSRRLPFVSRGGLKLAGGLDGFGLDVTGLVAADFGASTGGFTDCLLQRGAARVYAIDVGYGQLHPKLRDDPRVVVMERTNARHLGVGSLPEPVGLVVIDASFIGLGKLLPAARAVLAPGGQVVALVKPQFEAPKADAPGGVVRDPQARARAIDRVAMSAEALGFETLGRADASVTGPKGNREAFLHLRLGQDPHGSPG